MLVNRKTERSEDNVTHRQNDMRVDIIKKRRRNGIPGAVMN